MTTKEIALAVGKDERTVQRWAKASGDKMSSIGDKISSVGKSGIPADYTLEETLAIIEHGMGKNAASIYRMSTQPTQSTPVNSLSLDEAFKTAIIGISSMVASLDSRMNKIEKRVEERQALLPAPQISPRMNINKLVREYANKHNEQFCDVWKLLYSEYGYRKNYNPVVRANNRGMKTLDYIEQEDGLSVLESVALSVLK